MGEWRAKTNEFSPILFLDANSYALTLWNFLVNECNQKQVLKGQ